MGHQALPGPEQRGERFPLHAAGRALAPPLYVSTALWQEEGQESSGFVTGSRSLAPHPRPCHCTLFPGRSPPLCSPISPRERPHHFFLLPHSSTAPGALSLSVSLFKISYFVCCGFLVLFFLQYCTKIRFILITECLAATLHFLPKDIPPTLSAPGLQPQACCAQSHSFLYSPHGHYKPPLFWDTCWVVGQETRATHEAALGRDSHAH